MRSWMWTVAGALALAFVTPARAASPLRIASDDWCPYICVGGDGRSIASGFLVGATARALELNGLPVEPQLMPLNRALALVLAGQIDGLYAPSIDRRLVMSAPLIRSRACFYTRSISSWHYQGMASLARQQLGVIADYGYDDGPMDAYLARERHNHHLVEFNYGEDAGVKNIRKLLYGRYDVVLEHETVMAHLLAQLGEKSAVRQRGCLEHYLPLVVGFSARLADAHDIARKLDAGLAQMKASGDYGRLLQRYEISDPDPGPAVAHHPAPLH
ncbi:transporter substrate-binding domain-containing protein [Duganella sp. LX20W]|uniref:Transporter substrate-binding domain-containing protein n=1 Tax=Rugamonas brunnea TaxID=2758569 RepID=A0A7W2ESB5_9BURK|nr:transporter substrate-binding domain-containing protein [Rugamonas brunnea]MBA5637726.1 transporter substrate-binding domain-containing protein [Rugamonas brunnea]